MEKRMKRKVAAGAAALLAVAGGGAAIAATQLSPKQESQAVLNDAAGQLGVSPSELSAAIKSALEKRIDAAVAAGRITRRSGRRDEAANRVRRRAALRLRPRAGRLRAPRDVRRPRCRGDLPRPQRGRAALAAGERQEPRRHGQVEGQERRWPRQCDGWRREEAPGRGGLSGRSHASAGRRDPVAPGARPPRNGRRDAAAGDARARIRLPARLRRRTPPTDRRRSTAPRPDGERGSPHRRGAHPRGHGQAGARRRLCRRVCRRSSFSRGRPTLATPRLRAPRPPTAPRPDRARWRATTASASARDRSPRLRTWPPVSRRTLHSPSTRTIRTMGVEIVVAGADDRSFAAIESHFAHVDSVFSRFRPRSELNAVNAAESWLVPVSPRFAEAVETAIAAAGGDRRARRPDPRCRDRGRRLRPRLRAHRRRTTVRPALPCPGPGGRSESPADSSFARREPGST